MQYKPLSERPKRIYLDHNATTPHSPLLKQRWDELFEISGNPSSIHYDSRVPKTWLRETRQKFANYLGCSPLEIIFNSGASESNSSILKSAWFERASARNEIIVSSVEHPSVMKTVEYLKTLGAIIHYIPVNRSGEIDLNYLKQKLSDKTILVSVMFANNETGTIFPIKEISEMAHARGALMHSDCVQALGKENLRFLELNLDYASFSAHKFYSIKGTGVAYVKKNSPWQVLIHGGGQERHRRGGTENVIGIASFGIVLDQLAQATTHISEMQRLRDLFEKECVQNIPDVKVTAHESERVSNTSSLVIDGVDGETMLMSLDLKGFSVSTGAACSSGNPEPSPVLLAMGLTRQQAQNSLRVSLGWSTTEEEIIYFSQVLKETVFKLRQINQDLKSESIHV